MAKKKTKIKKLKIFCPKTESNFHVFRRKLDGVKLEMTKFGFDIIIFRFVKF